MKSTIVLLETNLLLCALACSDAEPSRAPVTEPATQAEADLSSGAAAADPRLHDECTPNIGARCATDSDCAQCAMAPRAFGTGRELVSTAVQCIGSACKRTGCPENPCPQGPTCHGCGVNLPCSCIPAPPTPAARPLPWLLRHPPF